MEFFTEVCNVRRSRIIVKDLAVLIEILHAYDVFVEANTPLGEALQVMYGKVLELDDAGAVNERERMRQDYSQQMPGNETLFVARRLL